MYNYRLVQTHDIFIIARYAVIYGLQVNPQKSLRSGPIAHSVPLHNNQMYNYFIIDGDSLWTSQALYPTFQTLANILP
jgi:hypothetical protein